VNKSAIEWCDYTWNPVVGCFKGCDYCYARRQAKRFKQRCQKCYEFVPHLHPERLDQPLKVKKPSRIFVCSMGELFDSTISQLSRDRVFSITQQADQHTFIVLTKQPENIVKDFTDMPNIWLGVSAENQMAADERIPELLKIPAAVRFVSLEPLLGAVDLAWHTEIGECDADGDWLEQIDWVIGGAQTGPKAVKPKPEWVQSIIDQCRAASIPLFIKDNVGWPERIQEFPQAVAGVEVEE